MEGNGKEDSLVWGIDGFTGVTLILGVTDPLPLGREEAECRTTAEEKPFCDDDSLNGCAGSLAPGVLKVGVGVVLELELSLAVEVAAPGCSFFALILLINSAAKLFEANLLVLFSSTEVVFGVPAPGVPEDLESRSRSRCSLSRSIGLGRS